MEFLRQLFHGKGYIDGITIINLDGEILFSAKLNSKFSNRKEREAYQALVGQNFFDVFENLNAKNSSMIRAMEVGLPVYVENQLLQTKGQEGIHISSLSIPIKSGRAVVGAIDLSMEEIASYTGRSLATFKRDFAKVSDLTPQKWLIKRRLEAAHELIKSGKKKVTEACFDVGFKNLSHFSKVYKETYGYAPSMI